MQILHVEDVHYSKNDKSYLHVRQGCINDVIDYDSIYSVVSRFSLTLTTGRQDIKEIQAWGRTGLVPLAGG